ncbi:UNC-like C-terminal-domain-containing protein [Astrocystis sublimbata]|nr:UNC-like C-terminal-domain-containing protein [Astrocystis sublimbata]
MWPSVKAPARILALVSLALLVLPDLTCAQSEVGEGIHGNDGNVSAPRDAAAAQSGSSAAYDAATCESRTVNYITDSLPQQCLTTGPISSVFSTPDTASATTTTTTAPASPDPPSPDPDPDPDPDSDPEGEDLSTGAFMSFEEWKAMMLDKSGPDALEAKPRRQRDGRADAAPGEGFDSLGDEGEISFDFDAYSDKISEIASSARPSERERERGKDTKEQVEVVAYDEGFTYYRSKDAGTTCKERFSYSSFDAGATVKKTSPAAKNPTAILVENKDSYMLLECGRKNKFFIVELSDVILVDTVVIANFEFFSSMVRQFRVSISDRYPVKLDKWKTLGTFQARNSRDIQPFLIENPQDWARYLRVEILSHYGNEYYCPVSLLRVHGLRMLDSWKQVDPSELEGDEDSPLAVSEPAKEAEETVEFVEEPPAETTVEVVREPLEEAEIVEPARAANLTASMKQNYTVMERSCWMPYWDGRYLEHTFARCTDCTRVSEFAIRNNCNGAHQVAVDAIEPRPSTLDERWASGTPEMSTAMTTARQTRDTSADVSRSTSSATTTLERPTGSDTSVSTSSSSVSRDSTSVVTPSSPTPPPVNGEATIQIPPKSKLSASTSIKPPSSRTSAKASSNAQATVRNKTSTATAPPPSAPTVQDSFFKALTKRLQILESNSTLSLQYIESQSRFLQEALAKLERRQIAKVDLFLDKLNNTVMSELREVKTLYDHIWQSTVIALELQREQNENEIVALSTRVGVLADEVVFQKRMAIVQSVLLLGCLVLVIFSRGFAGSAVEAYYPSQFLAAASSSRLASPTLPSTPRAQLRGARFSVEQGSASTGLARTGTPSHFLRVNDGRDSSQTPEQRSRAGSKETDSDSEPRPPTPERALSDPVGLEFQPPTPSSLDDMAYDSEPAMTPNDYFSAATSVNGDSASGGGEGEEVNGAYSEMVARQAERQYTPSSDAEAAEYILPRSGRPGLTHARKPLPALPEDPD